MRKKITASYVILIVFLTVSFTAIMTQSISNMLMIQLQERFVSEAKIVKLLFTEAVEDETTFDYQAFAFKIHQSVSTRITVIGSDGTVLADTAENPLNMNNHLNRTEVLEAIRTGNTAISTRFSNTVGADFLYVAVPAEVSGRTYVIRVSKRLTEIEALNDSILAVSVLMILSAAILTLIVSVYVSKRITRPIDALTKVANQISDGDYGKKIYIKANDQIGELASAFNKMSQNLDLSVNELRQRNSELEAILNSMINGIIAVDQSKNIIMINKFCFEILELPDDFVAENKSMYKIIRNEEIAKMVESAMAEGCSLVKELSYVHLDKILRIYVNPIFSSGREILGSIVVIQDVSQIRKLEQMRSDFVSNVSHELKTPLTSIKGFVDTLKGGAINNTETALRFLDIIDIESDRLYRLINDILLLSEIESMDREMEQTRVDLESVVNEVYDILEQKAKDKGLTLESHFECQAVLMANRDRIKQMLINLVDNAIKYTEKGKVEIVVSRIGNGIVIKVSDTGVGFSDVHKERLFERFYRVDKGRSRNQGGTGLGLSIVKHIVMLYKGRISVESTPGKGTTFEIVLPILE